MKKKIGIIFFLVLVMFSITAISASNQTTDENIENEINQNEIQEIINTNLNDGGVIGENKTNDLRLDQIHYTVIASPENGTAIFDFTHDFNGTGNITMNLLGISQNVEIINGKGRTIFENLTLNYGSSYSTSISVPGSSLSFGNMGGILLPDSFTNIISNNLVMYYKNGSQLIIQITNSKGVPYSGNYRSDGEYMFSGPSVSLTINGVKYGRALDENGTARFNINLNPGIYEVFISFDELYFASGPDNITILRPAANLTRNLTVLPTLDSKNLTKNYKNDSQYEIKVLDNNGNPIANKTVKMNINGVFYERITDSSGIATLNINLFPGDYIITVFHPESNLTISNFIKVIVKIDLGRSNSLSNSSFLVSISTADIPQEYVDIIVNGVKYQRNVKNAVFPISLKINLNPGDYEVLISYYGYTLSSNIRVYEVESSMITVSGFRPKYTSFQFLYDDRLNNETVVYR